MSDYQTIAIAVDKDVKNGLDQASEQNSWLNGARAMPGVTQVVDSGASIWSAVQGDSGVTEAMPVPARRRAGAAEPGLEFTQGAERPR